MLFTSKRDVPIIEQTDKDLSTNDIAGCRPEEEMTEVTERDTVTQKHRRENLRGPKDGVMEGARSNYCGHEKYEEDSADGVSTGRRELSNQSH